jgi:hypothetical protein
VKKDVDLISSKRFGFGNFLVMTIRLRVKGSLNPVVFRTFLV